MHVRKILWLVCVVCIAVVPWLRAAPDSVVAFESDEYESFIKSDPFAKWQNIALVEGAKAVLKSPSRHDRAADAVIDGRYEDDSYVRVLGTPFEITISLPRPEKISAVRIFPGRVFFAPYPSGESGIKNYRLQGYRSGVWFDLIKPVKNAPTCKQMNSCDIYRFNYVHTFEPQLVEKIRLIVTKSGDTRHRVDSNKIVPLAKLSSYVREIEIFSADKQRRKGIRYSFRQLLETDFVLPAYVNRKTATLFFKPTGLLKNALKLEVSFANRITREVPAEALTVTVEPGTAPTRLNIPIASWPDGEYFTTIRKMQYGSQKSQEILRVLRKQTIPAPLPPSEPIDVKGLTMLFVDNWYLAQEQGLYIKVHPAEQFPITTGAMEKGDYGQRSIDFHIEPDGTFMCTFWAQDRLGKKPRRYYTARSRDCSNWTISPKKLPAEQSRKKKPATASAAVASEKKMHPDTYRFYDPSVDGSVPLDKVVLKFSGYKKTKWGGINIPSGSTYPIWEKSKGKFLILLRESLARIWYTFNEKNPGQWRDGNDNFGGQWLSRDGKTLFYCQARLIPRYQPFRILYDLLADSNRILVVWRTSNGLNWTPTYFSMPTEKDPVGYQHYGAHIYTLEGGNLFLAELNAYNALTQQIYIELNYSRDGILWHRFPGQPAFASNGPFGSFNFGWLFAGNPIKKDGMAYQILYYCNNKAHFYNDFINASPGRDKPDMAGMTAEWLQKYFKGKDLRSWPFWKNLGSWQALIEDARKASQTVGLMRYREDGRTSITPKNDTGTFTTKVLNAGSGLSINAKTRPKGRILVEILNENFEPLPGYSGNNMAVFTGDTTDSRLIWSKGRIRKLPDSPIRLRVTIDRADIFALSW